MRLALEGIAKSFGPTRALDGVSFGVAPGTIHAVLGENGAGKSTLMKIVSGALEPDAGTLRLDGETFAPRDPAEARARGVAIVHQELSICPDLTVAENILLGVEPQRAGFVDRAEAGRRVDRALSRLFAGVTRLSPRALARDLAPAERQLVEIARALSHEQPRLLILDEPTSSLSSDDVDRLFAALSQLREQGLAIVYISHFLDEVRRVADAFTVLRDGRTVQSGQVADVSNDDLVEAMAGTRVERRQRRDRVAGDLALKLDAVAGTPLPRRASLALHRGEVVGIAGLLGSGRTELLRVVFGLDAVRTGEIRVGHHAGPATPHHRLRQGVGLLSEDRKHEGLAQALSVADNITLSKLSASRRRGLLSPRVQAEAARRWVERLGVKLRDVAQPVRELSGGNQQKVALARLLHHDVDVLLLDEPTRGIDVRSRSEVHALIDDLAERGKAVLVVSSSLPELLELCDRVAVMKKGVLGEARPVRELDEHTLLAEATGA